MIVPLAEAVAGTCGGKAAGLGALLRAGLPVPDGFVLPFAATGPGVDLDAAVRAGLSGLSGLVAASSPDRFAENDQVTKTAAARPVSSPDRFQKMIR
ncbi:hypothetical protein [Jiangella anatolica]|uniref:hypothetical protein n=1 Tax=Jiangella anatolica TaxID=2670374 RepID=UPI0018F4ECA1|nr:hypothetical protein [Jiangella anatolica]